KYDLQVGRANGHACEIHLSKRKRAKIEYEPGNGEAKHDLVRHLALDGEVRNGVRAVVLDVPRIVLAEGDRGRGRGGVVVHFRGGQQACRRVSPSSTGRTIR